MRLRKAVLPAAHARQSVRSIALVKVNLIVSRLINVLDAVYVLKDAGVALL